ncbi:MAG: hypothetical protein M0Z41_09220 [Peptococcaceae bacterium]|nr:hypothetical protein [Peptococcaceae bacterium]
MTTKRFAKCERPDCGGFARLDCQLFDILQYIQRGGKYHCQKCASEICVRLEFPAGKGLEPGIFKVINVFLPSRRPSWTDPGSGNLVEFYLFLVILESNGNMISWLPYWYIEYNGNRSLVARKGWSPEVDGGLMESLTALARAKVYLSFDAPGLRRCPVKNVQRAMPYSKIVHLVRM